MAKLQSYAGKGRDANKTFYRIQPTLPNKQRTTFKLGTGIKNAERLAKHIYELIDSAKASEDPRPETRACTRPVRACWRRLSSPAACVRSANPSTPS